MVSVVVPVYNSETTLRELVSRLAVVLPRTTDSFEVVLVNDGSRDGSWQTIVELAQAYSFVRGLDLQHNYGQHNALLAGIRAARGNSIVTMDDDLQHPPEELPRLLTALTDDVDVVYGRPRTLAHPLWRNLASRLARFLLENVMGVEAAGHFSAFRAFRAELRSAFANFRGPILFIDALLAQSTRRFKWVTVEHRPRQGRSSYSLGKLVRFALRMFAGFSLISKYRARSPLTEQHPYLVRQEIP
jgi:undecaprenyl-phosphate 4-deoxy-4-formamido-L-arabinose transferase